MKVTFRKSFEKDLRKLGDRQILAKVKAVIREVEDSQRLEKISNFKKLKTKGNYYRIRVGDYRIGITVDREVISFVRILHRREIYQKFP
ncbi:UNVERIFIED_CONTAM: plasmid stabilization protein [Euhalothece sp. KZN 001]